MSIEPNIDAKQDEQIKRTNKNQRDGQPCKDCRKHEPSDFPFCHFYGRGIDISPDLLPSAKRRKTQVPRRLSRIAHIGDGTTIVLKFFSTHMLTYSLYR